MSNGREFALHKPGNCKLVLQRGPSGKTEPGMDESGNRIGTTRELFHERRGSYSALRGIPAGILFLLMLWCAPRAAADEANSSKRPASYPKFQSALQSQMHTASELPQPNAAPEGPDYSIRIITALGLCGAFSLRLLIPRISKALDQRAIAAAKSAPVEQQKAIVEHEFVSQFASAVNSEPKDKTVSDDARRAALEEFYKTAPGLLTNLRNLFGGISRSPDPTSRQESLKGLGAEVESLKTRLGTFELVPAWQVASGVERLIGQLAEKPANVTPSTLRTVAGGLLLLNDLCVPDVRKDLASNPPVRFLAVDDDPISRRAVSMSLKKVSEAPDVAEHGEAALELAARQPYDAIFLDVEMPGLDGFETCTKIHQLEPNRVTPVVFVTSHSDFESRTKSTSSGGRDLIAKPFLSSEITLKAFTFLLRGRLDREKTSRAVSGKETAPMEAKTAATAANAETKSPTPAPDALRKEIPSATSQSVMQPSKASTTTSDGVQKIPSAEGPASKPATPDAPEHAEDFAVRGAEHLREIQALLATLSIAETPEKRREILGELYVGLNMFRSEAARAGLRANCELASALGKLVSKLLDKPALYAPSAHQAISAAILLLEELAAGGAEPNFANPPIRALVVDDEPLTRRAISNALQLTFGKPDNAENGEAAVALTQSKIFDVIFLDIMMPNMDGFETCSKIRETKLNGATPIIFVTSHNDTESRNKSFDCGGNGFISKPVLPAEIFLAALTFTLRARMAKGDAKVPNEQLEAALC